MAADAAIAREPSHTSMDQGDLPNTRRSGIAALASPSRLACQQLSGRRTLAAVAESQSAEQKVWAELYERFDPEKPAFDRAWRVERKYSPAKELARELARPMGGHKRFMVLGGLGSGKSTELYGIAEDRSREGLVVFVELVRHFEKRVGDAAALDRVQPWEVLLTRRHLGVLRTLLKNPDELPDDDVVGEMLDICLILPYPDESTWYLPHPLLLKARIPRLPPSGAMHPNRTRPGSQIGAAWHRD